MFFFIIYLLNDIYIKNNINYDINNYFSHTKKRKLGLNKKIEDVFKLPYF